MSKLIPDYVFDSIYDITPALLAKHGVRGVLIDLDGTMASHKAALPPEKLSPFVRTLHDAGLKVLVFSNNREARVGKFCRALGVDFISRAGKPFAAGFRRAAERLPAARADCGRGRPDLYRRVRRQPHGRTDLLCADA